MALIKVCDAAALPAGELIQFAGGPEPIAVYNVDGEFFATQDRCTHGDWSLAEGYLDGHEVQCTLHMAKFCVRTGAALSAPAWEALAVYPVVVADGTVFVDVDGGRIVAEKL